MKTDNQLMTLTPDQGSITSSKSRIAEADRIDRPGADGGRERHGTLWPAATPEETLVVDDRAGQTPAQAVESKLMRRLQGASLSVSHLQMRGLVRSRRGD